MKSELPCDELRQTMNNKGWFRQHFFKLFLFLPAKIVQ